MKHILVVCFQFLYSNVKLKQFVCTNSDKPNLAAFERASLKESFLSCALGHLLTSRHFRDDKNVRDNSLVSEPPIQLVEGLSWQCMISSLGNDAL